MEKTALRQVAGMLNDIGESTKDDTTRDELVAVTRFIVDELLSESLTVAELQQVLANLAQFSSYPKPPDPQAQVHLNTVRRALEAQLAAKYNRPTRQQFERE